MQLPSFKRALAVHSGSSFVAVGRKFTCANKGTLLGGGPGIAMSRGTLERIAKLDCVRQNFPIISRSVPGGDGWLGQCMNFAQIVLINDWRFKPVSIF